MDEKSQETFNEILRKDQESLSTEEREFLMARRSYLNDADRKRFADIIEEHEANIGKSGDGLDEKSVAELKEMLDEKEVEYPASAKKPALLKLLRAE